MCVISSLAYTLFQFAHFLNSADRFFHARILLNIFIFHGHFLGFKKLTKLKSEKFVRDQPSPSIIQIFYNFYIFTCPKLKWFTKSVASKLEALPIWQTLFFCFRISAISIENTIFLFFLFSFFYWQDQVTRLHGPFRICQTHFFKWVVSSWFLGTVLKCYLCYRALTEM